MENSKSDKAYALNWDAYIEKCLPLLLQSQRMRVTQRGALDIGSDLPSGGDALSALTIKGGQGGKAGKCRHLGIQIYMLLIHSSHPEHLLLMPVVQC